MFLDMRMLGDGRWRNTAGDGVQPFRHTGVSLLTFGFHTRLRIEHFSKSFSIYLTSSRAMVKAGNPKST